MGDDDIIEAMDIDHEEEEEVEEKVDDEQKDEEKAPSSSPYVWSAFYDDEGTLYYYNSETQESAWEPPPNGEGFNPAPPPPVEEGQEEDDDHAAAAAAAAAAAHNTKKEAKAETTAEDENDAAATATTDAPADTEAAATTVADDDENNIKASVEEEVEEKVNTTTAAAAAAAASKWIRYKGDEGEYFYNAETDETQWEEPEEGFVDAEEEVQEQAEEAEVVSQDEQQQQSTTTAADNDQKQQQEQNEEDVDTTMVDVGKNDDNDQELPSDDEIADETEMEEPESEAVAAAASSSSSKWVRYSGDTEGAYYYNTDTQATQWEAPEEGFMEAEEYEAASEAANVVGASGEQEQGENQESTTGGEDGEDGEEPTTGSAAAAAAASSWVRYKDDEGNDYYFNTETEASQWDVPEGFVESASAATEAKTAASASANEGDVPEKKASPGDQGKEPDDQEKEQQQKLDKSMDEPAADDDDDNDKREEEVQEEIDPAVKRLQEAENALNKPDSIFEPSCFDNVTEVVSSQGGNPQKALTALLDNYQGQTAICGLLARWLASLKSTTPNSSSDTTPNAALTVAGSGNAATSAAAAAAGSSEAMAEEIRTTVQDVINRTAKKSFSKEAGDSILNLSRQKAAFLEDMMESTRWRKLLIDLSASHKDSAVLKYCLGSIADRGHHREIAKRINQADHFTVFRQMLQSELAAIGKVAVSAGTDPVTSIGMDELVNDLKRACTATSYTYLYSLQVLRALESKARKELQELQEESDDPGNIRLRRAVRKWEVFCEILENSMVDPAASMAGSSTVFHKRRLDVALTINELTQRQRKRQRPGDDDDTDNGMNGHDDKGQSALETALLRFLRRYALGVQVDDSLLDPLLPSGLDTVNAGKQIGALLVKHSLTVRALLGYLYKPGATRVTAPVVKNKCARLIALAVRAAEEMAWAEYKAPKVKGGEDGELDNDDANSRELSDEVALTRVVLQGSQLCEQLESMVSFLVSVDKSPKDNNGSGIPPGPGQKLCTLAFHYAPVAQGVMMWAREFTHGNEFATSASFPTLSVSILSLARLVGINQPFARGDALTVALQFLRHTNRDVSYQKINAIKEQSLRLLIHLLMQGEVAAVLNAITSRLQQQSSSELDASLIRYFVAGVLEAVRPPVSCACVRLFAQLLLSPLCIDAVRSTYFQAEHRTRLVQLVLAFPKVRTFNGKKLEGEDLAVVNSLMATYQIKSE